MEKKFLKILKKFWKNFEKILKKIWRILKFEAKNRKNVLKNPYFAEKMMHIGQEMQKWRYNKNKVKKILKILEEFSKKLKNIKFLRKKLKKFFLKILKIFWKILKNFEKILKFFWKNFKIWGQKRKGRPQKPQLSWRNYANRLRNGEVKSEHEMR